MNRMSKFIDAHKEILKNTGDLYFETHSNLPNHYLNFFNPNDGKGFTELYDFDRLCVGKGKYWLKHPVQMQGNRQHYNIGFTILLSGTHHITNESTHQTYIFNSPKILLRRGILGSQTLYLKEHTPTSLISLDFDESLLDLIEPSNEFVQFFLDDNTPQIKALDIPDKDIHHHAQYLFNLPTAKNMLDLLHVEGASLELLSLLLQKKKQDTAPIPVIQHAISILETQFDQKLTIRYLSKQVGINECYLKRLFKQTTGHTIGKYLLNTRMQYAQSLLKQGLVVEHVANQIGYSNAQYFKQIFAQHYGYQP